MTDNNTSVRPTRWQRLVAWVKGWGLFEGDMVVWMILITLCLVSIVEVYSASSRDSYKEEYFFSPVLKHGSLVAVSLFLAWITSKIPCKKYMLICTFCLFVIALPLTVYSLFVATLNDTQRWVIIGGVSVQPSEMVKLCLIGFTAFVLSIFHRPNGAPDNAALKIVCWVTGFFCFLIGKENLSTAGLLFIVIFAMLWIADANRKFLVVTAAILCIGGGACYMTIKTMPETTVKAISTFKIGSKAPLKRFETWAHRLQDKDERPAAPKDYNITKDVQVTHARIALANSRVIGRGPGKSVERDFIPQANCDFIYAIILEEGGILSGAAILFLYLLLFYRSWRIASECVSRFPAYLVMGLALMMVLQAMVNMAVAVGLGPVTGQPLPLISKGGSSGIITCIYIGIILSVSRSAKKIKPEVAEATA